MSKELSIQESALQIVERELKAAGIEDKKPFQVLARLLDAKKMTVDKFGEEHFEDDNTAQSKALELVLRLKKLLDNKVEDIKVQAVFIQPTTADISRLESITLELKQLQERLNTNSEHKGKIIEVEYSDAVTS